jgi:hypothetical protein
MTVTDDFGYSLWTEASADHDAERHAAALDEAGAHLASVMPFLLQAETERELGHRLSFAGMRLRTIEASTGVPVPELEDMARRHFALLKEALPEGVDPLQQLMQSGHSYGSGPEKPDEHDEGPDFSGGYSEVPMGYPGGPDPSVVTPYLTQPGPVQEATGSRHRRHAQGGSDVSLAETPPDTDTGFGSVDLDPADQSSTQSGRSATSARRYASRRYADSTAGSPAGGMSTVPAGVGGMPSSPDGSSSSPAAQPLPPLDQTVTSQGPDTSFDLTPTPSAGATSGTDSGTSAITGTGSRRDPVAAQIRAVASSVAVSNPQLPASECRRVARRVVGGYLRRADLDSSVMSDDPGDGDGPAGGAAPQGGGGNAVEHGAEFQVGKSVARGLMGGAEDAAAAAF